MINLRMIVTRMLIQIKSFPSVVKYIYRRKRGSRLYEKTMWMMGKVYDEKAEQHVEQDRDKFIKLLKEFEGFSMLWIHGRNLIYKEPDGMCRAGCNACRRYFPYREGCSRDKLCLECKDFLEKYNDVPTQPRFIENLMYKFF